MSWYDPTSWTDESQSAVDQRNRLSSEGTDASNFAGQGRAGFDQSGQDIAGQQAALQRLAQGQDSYSAEQLRQALGQNIAGQRSMAAGGPPSSAPMMARLASMNAARMGSGLAGQQAIAGIQERQSAQQMLAQLMLQKRQQDLSAALGSQQNAIGAYGGIKPEGTPLDKAAPLINAGVGAAGFLFGRK